MKQVKLSEEVGLNRAAISQYATGKTDIPKYVVSLLRYAYNLNPNWLLQGRGNMLLPEKVNTADTRFFTRGRTSSLENKKLRSDIVSTANVDVEMPENKLGERVRQSEFVAVRLLGKVAAGMPIPTHEDWDGSYAWVSKSLVAGGNADDFYVLTVKGESMIEAGIHNGDEVVVHHQNVADHGKIVVAMLDDEATIKQVFFWKDSIELRPFNKNFESLFLKDKSDFRIQGVVVGLLRRF